MSRTAVGLDPARTVTVALDRFFAHYYQRRPVTATFTGEHAFDDLLPDWSSNGLDACVAEMRALHTDLGRAHPPVASASGYAEAPDALDAELARAFLETQSAEVASAHGVRGNPSLWTGEAIFSVIALMTREFAPFDRRVLAAAARLAAIPEFLERGRVTLSTHPLPAAWTSRALRECEGAAILLTRGMQRWTASAPLPGAHATLLLAASGVALASFEAFAQWLRSRPVADDNAMAVGPDVFDLFLERGHQCRRSRSELERDARAALRAAVARLEEMARERCGSWDAVQSRLIDDHPSHADYLSTFGRVWNRCHECAAKNEVVTWPEWPIHYVPLPDWTRDAAPFLYYLFYRSPAPGDHYTIHDYVVTPLPATGTEQHLRAWNRSVIKLNHVVHHGAIGHHVQNWYACHQARSRIGRVAAVDCASRIGMMCGGTMAEGWACYATDLMEELGFLTPLEEVSQQHSRVRLLARAVVDIGLHQGSMTFADAVRFYQEHARMPHSAALAEATKNSMFPCTAIMYWLGTQGIHELRRELELRRGPTFSLRQFHDELLGYGSIPVPLVARIMLERAA
ncbi:MAG TPA: DUF885 family protein [Gemmatimonadaceae bacterium]|nr:DUF885 family protein [Gemmatimonadaceae bacterium]